MPTNRRLGLWPLPPRWLSRPTVRGHRRKPNAPGPTASAFDLFLVAAVFTRHETCATSEKSSSWPTTWGSTASSFPCMCKFDDLNPTRPCNATAEGVSLGIDLMGFRRQSERFYSTADPGPCAKKNVELTIHQMSWRMRWVSPMASNRPLGPKQRLSDVANRAASTDQARLHDEDGYGGSSKAWPVHEGRREVAAFAWVWKTIGPGAHAGRVWYGIVKPSIAGLHQSRSGHRKLYRRTV